MASLASEWLTEGTTKPAVVLRFLGTSLKYNLWNRASIYYKIKYSLIYNITAVIIVTSGDLFVFPDKFANLTLWFFGDYPYY